MIESKAYPNPTELLASLEDCSLRNITADSNDDQPAHNSCCRKNYFLKDNDLEQNSYAKFRNKLPSKIDKMISIR